MYTITINYTVYIMNCIHYELYTLNIIKYTTCTYLSWFSHWCTMHIYSCRVYNGEWRVYNVPSKEENSKCVVKMKLYAGCITNENVL